MTANGLLSEVARTFTDKGLVETQQRPSFQAEGCKTAGTTDLVRHEYTAEGLLETTTTAASGRVETTFYANDRLYPQTQVTTVTRYVDGTPVGDTELSASYDFDRRTGASTTTVDPNNVETRTDRDSLGRELAVYLVRSNALVLTLRVTEYEDVFPLTAESTSYLTSENSVTKRTHFDGTGKVIGVVEETDDGFVRSGYAQYDAFGRAVLTALSVPASSLDDYEVPSDDRFTESVIDGFNRTRVVTKPDATSTSFEHGPRWIEEMNARGYVTRREFDWRGAARRIERRGDGDVSATHTIERDGRGRIASIYDADGTVRHFERDLGGRLRFASLPHEAGAMPLRFEYCYDAEDALFSTVTPGGRYTTLSLDELGRVVATNSTYQGTNNTSYRSYDDPEASFGLGRLTRELSDAGVTDTDYDVFGRLQRVEQTLPDVFFDGGNGPRVFDATLAYDFVGNLDGVSVSAPGALGDRTLTVTYARDSVGRATGLTSGTGSAKVELVSEVVFDAANRLVNAEFANGIAANWDYDPVTQHLTSIAYLRGASAVASVLYPEHDAMGNLEREQRLDADGMLTEKIHTYDALDRLDSSHLWHPGGNKDESFAYSPAGNMETAGHDTYEYERANLPQSVTQLHASAGVSRSLTYDDDGFLQSDTWVDDGSETTGIFSRDRSHERTLTWDARGCLTSVVAGDGGDLALTTDYICDGGGNTVARKTTLGETVSSRFDVAGIGELLLEEGILLVRLPVGGTVHVQEAWSLDTGERVVGKSGYMLNDSRGSVLARTAFNGDIVVEEAEYDAWGATASISDLPAPRHQFTGEEPDPFIGLYHFGVRTYDPTLRRWLSPDPLFLTAPEKDEQDGAQWNLYQYAANNPVRFLDPDGTRIVLDAAMTPTQRKTVLRTMQKLTRDTLYIHRDKTTGVREIRIKKVGEEPESKDPKVRKDRGTLLVRRVRKSSRTVTVVYRAGGGNEARPTDWVAATDGTGSDATVWFDPNQTPVVPRVQKNGRVVRETGASQSTMLGHELIHGDRSQRGVIIDPAIDATITYKDSSGATASQTYKAEEFATVGLKGATKDDVTERQLGEEAGEKLRGAYY